MGGGDLFPQSSRMVPLSLESAAVVLYERVRPERYWEERVLSTEAIRSNQCEKSETVDRFSSTARKIGQVTS